MHTHKARLTYSWGPACLADGQVARNLWFTVYGRDGRVLVETQDAAEADNLAAEFAEISGAEPETRADAAY
jgi:hypothetical protein